MVQKVELLFFVFSERFSSFSSHRMLSLTYVLWFEQATRVKNTLSCIVQKILRIFRNWLRLLYAQFWSKLYWYMFNFDTNCRMMTIEETWASCLSLNTILNKVYLTTLNAMKIKEIRMFTSSVNIIGS